jgi:hypothetical protein
MEEEVNEVYGNKKLLTLLRKSINFSSNICFFYIIIVVGLLVYCLSLVARKKGYLSEVKSKEVDLFLTHTFPVLWFLLN